MRLTENENTGEHTCVMLREFHTSGLDVDTKPGWLMAFAGGMYWRGGGAEGRGEAWIC